MIVLIYCKYSNRKFRLLSKWTLCNEALLHTSQFLFINVVDIQLIIEIFSKFFLKITCYTKSIKLKECSLHYRESNLKSQHATHTSDPLLMNQQCQLAPILFQLYFTTQCNTLYYIHNLTHTLTLTSQGKNPSIT